MMLFKYNDKYEKKYDSFRIEFLIPPCFILALFLNFEFKVWEVKKKVLIKKKKKNYIKKTKTPGHLDFFNLFGSCCNLASTFHAFENKLHKHIDHQLYLLFGSLQRALYHQLDL